MPDVPRDVAISTIDLKELVMALVDDTGLRAAYLCHVRTSYTQRCTQSLS